MKSRYYVVFLLCALCMTIVSLNNAAARPPRHHPRRARPIVVRPKAVVPHKPKSAVVVAAGTTPGYAENMVALTPEEIKKRRIKVEEYGLIDFEVYPYSTKIYIDGIYKGHARSLNKDKNSLKVRKGKHLIKLKDSGKPAKVINVNVKAGHKLVIKIG